MEILTKIKFECDYKDSLLTEVSFYLPIKLQKGDFISIEDFINEEEFSDEFLLELENNAFQVDSVNILKYSGELCQWIVLINK